MEDKTSGHSATAAPATGKKAGMTKIEAIRRAIHHLGEDAKPVQIQAYIKDKLGIDIATNHISASKTEIIRKMTSKAKPASPKPLAAAKPQAKPAAKTAAGGNGKTTGSIGLDDIAAVKGLVGRIAPVQLKALIDLLVK